MAQDRGNDDEFQLIILRAIEASAIDGVCYGVAESQFSGRKFERHDKVLIIRPVQRRLADNPQTDHVGFEWTLPFNRQELLVIIDPKTGEIATWAKASPDIRLSLQDACAYPPPTRFEDL